MEIQLPRTYTSLAELMLMQNRTYVETAHGPGVDVDDRLVALYPPHSEAEIAAAWKVWVVEGTAYWNGYIVPTGFLTDFASIPKLVRWLFDPVGAPWQVAAVFHDWIYSSDPDATRREADSVYYYLACAMGTGKLVAGVQWLALRVGGWAAWRSNRKRLAAEGPTWRNLNK